MTENPILFTTLNLSMNIPGEKKTNKKEEHSE